VHFNPNYALNQAAVTVLAQQEEPAPMEERDIRKELQAERARLGRGDWRIGVRSATTAITLHWNGPAVAAANQRGDGARRQLFADLRWQTDPNWAGAKGGADGLQYHAAVDADGCVWHCRDHGDKLWHCGHAVGNNESLSLHLLLGRGQQPTEAQWRATVNLIEEWRARYRIPQGRVFGHQEWAASECPGPAVMQRLKAYCAGSAPAIPPSPAPLGLRRFVVALPASASATVRQGPSRAYPIVAHLRPGHRLWVDAVLDDEQDETIAGHRQWAHMAAVPDQQSDLGFVHMSALREES
jgi:hypothetical protein